MRIHPLRALVLAPIKLYRKLVSPLLPPRCRYYPTCSNYAQQAVAEYGAARGIVLAAWRVLRCNPLSDGGFDYVEDQTLFKAAPRSGCGHSHHGASDRAGVAR